MHRPLLTRGALRTPTTHVAGVVDRLGMLARWTLAVSLLLGGSARADDSEAHPQDGPHAELRLTVADDAVRLGVGVNLAFMDQVVEPSRESVGAVVGAEREALVEGIRAWLAGEVSATVNGQAVEARLEQTGLFADPAPAMSAIYPIYGPRALIRTVTTLVFEAPVPGEAITSLTLTWPAYPKDTLNAQMEGLTLEEAPSLFLEAQFRAGGAPIRIIRFSEAEPTFSWSADEDAERAAPLPEPPAPVAAAQGSGLGVPRIVGVGGLLLGLVFLAVKKLRALGVVAIFAGGAIAVVFGPSRPEAETPSVEEAQARAVFGKLHDRMYRAFDFTAESEIYDALAQSVSGDLLEETYIELYTMLVQTEQEGLIGQVTGVDRLDVEITPRDGEAPAFDVLSTWRVRGTVYHWGHSHTREDEYEASFTIAPVSAEEGRSWRITERQILSQRRLDAPQAPDQGEL